jgi:hypothetical protein
MMAMLGAGGIPALTDGVRGADEDNRRGYFEYEPVKRLGVDGAWVERARGRAVKVVIPLVRSLPAGFGYRVVLMSRSLGEVAASQRAMLERAGKRGGRIGEAELVRLYEGELARTRAWLGTREGVGFVEVSYNDLMREPGRAVDEVGALLGGLDRGAMLAAIDPALYRQRGGSAGARRGADR